MHSTTTPTHQCTRSTHSIHHRGPQPRGSLALPGHFGFPGPNNFLVATVYRKLMHMDHYLTRMLIISLQPPKSVFNAFAFRAKVVCTNQHMLQQEVDHIRKALLACNCPPWAHRNLLEKFNYRHSIHNTQQSPMTKITIPTTMDPTAKTFPLWYHIQKALMKNSRRPATTWSSRCTSKETRPFKLFLWPLRIKTINAK